MVEMKFTGKVLRGKREGTKIGFPTANIEVLESTAPGIYAGYTSLKDQAKNNLPSIFYIAEESQVIESHVFDFSNTDLYGSEISVEIVHKLRNVRKFSGLEEAREQIKKDELEARKWFDSRKS